MDQSLGIRDLNQEKVIWIFVVKWLLSTWQAQREFIIHFISQEPVAVRSQVYQPSRKDVAPALQGGMQEAGQGGGGEVENQNVQEACLNCLNWEKGLP